MEKNKMLIGVVLLGAVIIIGMVYVLFTTPAPVATDTVTSPTSSSDIPEAPAVATSSAADEVPPRTTTLEPAAGVEATNTVTPVESTVPPKPVVTTPVVVEPVPPTPAPAAPTGITMATVATHGSVSSCWSAIDGKVYDLTAYVPKHPGGKSEILAICGKDGSSLFNGQHGGDSKPERVLAGYYVDVLTQ